MSTQQTLTRFSRISGAGILIAFSGMAVALADTAPTQSPAQRSSAETGAAQKALPSGESLRSAAGTKQDQQAIREKIDNDLRNGKYTEVAKLLPTVQPQLKDLNEVELLRIVAERARQLLEEEKNLGRPGSNNGTGGGVVVFDGADDSAEIDRGILRDGEWRNPPDVPGIGEGWRSMDTHRLRREKSMRYARLYLRSIYGGYADFSNLAFADAVEGADGGGIWPPLELPSNTVDFDGDGEVFDPLPARPVVVYYQFLEESMTDIEWDDGEDNLNQVGLRTNDDNEDDVIDFADLADETDGIADTWPANPAFVNRSVIPPPDPNDFDEELFPFLQATGLGGTRWGDARPIFLHPDAEAAWRLAQSLYFDSTDPDAFEETFDSNQVLEEEERQLVLTAMRVIESVTNIVFIERPDWGGFTPGTAPFLQSLGPGISYPLNAVGWTLDNAPPTLAVDPGGIPSGAQPAVTEVPWFPEDDYPWMLILKGSNPANGENGVNATSETGTTRNPPPLGAPSIDYIFTDLDGDGFPDTPDSNGDGLPDQVIFSSLGAGNIVPLSDASRSVLDNNLDTAISSADVFGAGFVVRGLQSGQGVAYTVGAAPNFLMDMNFDGTLDEMLDLNGDGDASVIDIFNDLAIDVDADGAADSVFPGGTTASLNPFPFDAIPCGLVGLTQNLFDTQDVGFIVYTLMGQLSLADEHTRPDREDFIRVLEENIDSNNGGLDIVPGGSDKYANFIDNFDTTTETVPAVGLTPHAPGNWTLDNSGATAGGWSFLDPTMNPNDGAAPTADYAVDDDDLSAIALVTGSFPDTQIQGTAVFTSPNIYGPQDASVRFAYWINSESGDPIQDGDGLIVQTSADSGATWEELTTLTNQSDEWQLAEVLIGETLADSQTGLPTFQVRFIAQNTDPARAIEIAIDRIRVQNPYDFLSATHGGPFFAARTLDPGFETIQVREGFEEFADQIGQAGGLSLGDRIGLSNLYGIPVFPDGSGPAPDPCRADVNGDGVISAVDVALFLDLFNAGDMRADFADPEGVLDIYDLLAFFNDVQNSFRCINDPDNNFGLNNLTDITPG